MRQPNDLIRQARLARRSPSGSGRVLSRQELAEAVNAHIYTTTGRLTHLSDNYVGDLERGTIRWPMARYREAFRAVLGADTNAELGLYINRPSRSDTEAAARVADRVHVHSEPAPVEIGRPLTLTEPTWIQVLVSPGTTVTVVCTPAGSTDVAVVAASIRLVVGSAVLDGVMVSEQVPAVAGRARLSAPTGHGDEAAATVTPIHAGMRAGAAS